ncbi:hypothetical protein F4678DRAFT_481754 [Xylaria arbuscula]|nr:hypothetical protein F4678DRAFT_481754 [Xylaria arbuscula]
MCILLYNICSKCFCGYPRFTESCTFMHPPLIYCPHSTRFKFRIVDGSECHLHPHHAPLLHLGANDEDTARSVSPSGPGPSIEAHIPSQGERSTSKGEEAYTTLQIAPVLRQTDFQALATENMQKARNVQESQQNNYHATSPAETIQPADRDGQAHANDWQQNASSQDHRYLASQNHNQSRWQTANLSNWAKENKVTKNIMSIQGSVPRGDFPSSLYGSYTNGPHSRTPFDFRCHPRNGIQYQYYPHQAAPPPPFHACSGSTPLGCTYMLGQGWSQCPQLNQDNRNTSGKPPPTSQAIASVPHSKETSKSISERRRENLEQLQRSNDAAYYNCRHHRNCQSLSRFEDDFGTETRPSLLPGPQTETSNAKDACPTMQTAKVDHSKPRSLSESCIQRLFTDENRLPTTQGDHSFYHGNYAQDAGYGKENETVTGLSSTIVNLSPRGTSVRPATPDRSHVKDFRIPKETVEINPMFSNEAEVKTDCDVSIKQESDDEDYKPGNPTEWTPRSVKTDPESEVKLYDIPTADIGKTLWNRAPAEDIQSDISGDGWSSALGSPPVPPNSPISLFSSGKSPIHRQIFEDENLRRDLIEGFDAQRQLQPSISDREARLDDRRAEAIVASPKDLSSNSSIKSYKMSGLDLSENIPSAQNFGLKSGKTWSAVVSGSYVPSKASDSVPAAITAPTRIDDANGSTYKKESTLAKSASVSSLPATTFKTLHELPHDPSTVPTPIRPIFPTNTWEYPTPPPNSPTNSSIKSIAPEKSLEMLGYILERRFSSGSSLGSDDFETMTSTTLHSETDETAPASVSQPAQPPQHANLPPPTGSSQASQTTPVAHASASETTEVRMSPQPRSWSQLFQRSSGSKKIPNLKPRSESNIDDTDWPPLGSFNPNNARKRNTSS